jgi:hypothetical protein
MTNDWAKLEALVEKIQKNLAPKAQVLRNVKLDGRLSGVKRQIDVLVQDRIGQYEFQIVIDAKDHKVPIDVKGVEEFQGLLRDVGAHKGVLVSPMGFTAAAKTVAKNAQIDLYSPVDTDSHKWQASVTVPVICDFRKATIDFRVGFNALGPFSLPEDFVNTSMVYDGNEAPLGTIAANAVKMWNSARFPHEPGEHNGLRVFLSSTTLMDNGKSGPLAARVPVELTASLHVERELFFGSVGIKEVSGFLDHHTGMVVANAMTTDFFDSEKVEKEWLKIASEDEAPKEPLFTMVGFTPWSASDEGGCEQPA